MPNLAKSSLLAAAVLLGGMAQAFAGGLVGQPDRDTLIREGRFDELQILENRERRIEFQQRQQRLREVDRQTANQPTPRPDVPVVRPGCRIDVFGSNFLRACR
ncbi:hypothetical protein [Mesorhizobium sp. CC13]|uniref:hypothetical protein n=1 Tax=Phyllobacteriaceae TaxID=69277 RepID=UPI0032658FE7